MPRDIPVGNGRLLVCFDQNYCIREIYFPHVGLENHVGGKVCRLGVWVDGQFSWVGPEWERDLHLIRRHWRRSSRKSAAGSVRTPP